MIKTHSSIKYHLTAILLIAFYSLAYSQSALPVSSVDSLFNLLKLDKQDTNKVNHLNELATRLLKNNADTSFKLCDEAILVSKNIREYANVGGWQKGIANANFVKASTYQRKQEWDNAIVFYLKSQVVNQNIGRRDQVALIMTQIGDIYYDQSDYVKARDYYTKGLEIEREIASTAGEAIDLNKIGLVFYSLGDYPKALDLYFQALKINEVTGRKNGVAANLSNIGNVYMDQNDYQKALMYMEKALKINEELKRKRGIAVNNGNIGLVHKALGNYSKALMYFEKALKLNEELDRKTGIAENLSNIGIIYKYKADSADSNSDKEMNYSIALDYYYKSFAVSEKTGDKGAMANVLDLIGAVEIALKKYAEAFDNIYKAIALAMVSGEKHIIKNNYGSLSLLYEKSSIKLLDTIGGRLLSNEEMRLRSKYYYQRMIAVRDELFSLENKKKIVQNEMNFEFAKKEAAVKYIQEQKDNDALAERRKQKYLLFLISGVLILVFVFTGFILRSLRITKKQKLIIEEQKLQVEEKNKDIVDSINYAKKIQDAVLKEEEHISDHLPEHFAFLKSKDIVSGDFHWALEKQGHFYMSAVDCTGHGVPGAFMSLLGVAFLNEISATPELLTPSEVLELLREKIVKELGQGKTQNEAKDGMDMSMGRLNLATREFQWAGANNPIYLIKDGVCKEIKANKQSIGYQENMQPFTNHTIQLEKGTTFYLFTDGYADQFGGAAGKKFKYSQLRSTLLAINGKSMKEQKNILRNTLEAWKGELDQVDDICILGIRV